MEWNTRDVNIDVVEVAKTYSTYVSLSVFDINMGGASCRLYTNFGESWGPHKLSLTKLCMRSKGYEITAHMVGEYEFRFNYGHIKLMEFIPSSIIHGESEFFIKGMDGSEVYIGEWYNECGKETRFK